MKVVHSLEDIIMRQQSMDANFFVLATYSIVKNIRKCAVNKINTSGTLRIFFNMVPWVYLHIS